MNGKAVSTKGDGRIGDALQVGEHRLGVRDGLDQYDLSLRDQPRLNDETKLIADWLVALIRAKKTWGFGLYFLHMCNGFACAAIGPSTMPNGFKWLHKRVWDVYCELELNTRIKTLKRWALRVDMVRNMSAPGCRTGRRLRGSG